MTATTDPTRTGPAGSLLAVLDRHRAGEAVGVTSVCSGHPLVIDAALARAAADGSVALVEATSNQVDQFGGYTGQQPADAARAVLTAADRAGLPRERVVLGGDHLGPNRWRDHAPERAMALAEEQVAAYVEAGFTKLHLDCSMALAGDPEALDDEVVAARAARLARTAEAVSARRGTSGDLVYVVGTEVPVPGGAAEELGALRPTSPDAARATIAAHEEAFAAAGVGGAWPRVVGLVVQPGVEFDHLRVVDYAREAAQPLRAVVEGHPHLVFEAHSTDYQTRAALTALVEDHWAVLKVGPGLTFALREAVLALAAIEAELVDDAERSRLPEVLEERMLEVPRWWEGYYTGEPHEQRLARRYSYSDRLRYYWPDPRVERAVQRLFATLAARPLPLPLLSQHLPVQHDRVRRGVLAAEPRALVVDRVDQVLRDYAAACGSHPSEDSP